MTMASMRPRRSCPPHERACARAPPSPRLHRALAPFFASALAYAYKL